MKTLKFRTDLVKEIKEGRKTSTWRLFDDKNLSVGDRVALLEWESKEQFAETEIVKIYEKKLGEIEVQDFDGHSAYENKEEMLKAYKEYYGDRVTFDTVIKIIKFGEITF